MLAARYKPDVALVDLFIGEESGPEICQQLRERSPTTNVLLISGAGRISPGRREGGRRRRASSPRTGAPPTSPAPCAWSGSA